MKRLAAILLSSVLLSGCASKKPPTPVQLPLPSIVMPDDSLAAKVISYNDAGQFVVLGFPPGQMPQVDQMLFIYRDGLKVGEVKITGPERDNDIVADLIEGEARAGDEVRQK